jgi:hypothetical protein
MKLSVAAMLAVLSLPVAAQSKVFPDPAGDVKIRSLDIRKVDASVAGGTVSIKIILATRTQDNAFYGAYVSCGKKLWQIAAKRAARETFYVLFDSVATQQTDLPGDPINGRTVRLTAPAAKLGCTKANFRFYASTEDLASGRTDDVPAQKSAKSFTWLQL